MTVNQRICEEDLRDGPGARRAAGGACLGAPRAGGDAGDIFFAMGAVSNLCVRRPQ